MNKTKKGGARKGAGRKPEGNNRVKVNFKLLPEVAFFLRNQKERPSIIIEKLIIEKFLT